MNDINPESAFAVALQVAAAASDEMKWETRWRLAAYYRPGFYAGPFESDLRLAELRGANEAAPAFARAIRSAQFALKSWQEWVHESIKRKRRPALALPPEFADSYQAREIISRLWGGFWYWKVRARRAQRSVAARQGTVWKAPQLPQAIERLDVAPDALGAL